MRPSILLLVLVTYCLPLFAERYVIASDFHIDLPPLFWRDTCTGEFQGFGWRLQQRLWHDLGVDTQHYQINMHREDSLERLSQLMKDGTVDAYLTMPLRHDDTLNTTEEPFFWLPDNLYQRHDSQWQFKEWADLKGKKGVMIAPVKNYDRRSSKFKAYAQQHLDLRLVESYVEGFTQLSEGQVDYLITYRLIGSTFIELYKLRALKSSPIKHIASPTYLAIANQSPLMGEKSTIDGLLVKYKKSGIATLLLQSSLQQWVAEVNNPKKCNKKQAAGWENPQP